MNELIEDNKSLLVKIPTLRGDMVGYRWMFILISEVIKNPKRSFFIDFKHCSRIDYGVVCLLGALAKYVDFINGSGRGRVGRLFKVNGIRFLEGTMSPLIRRSLTENNFLSYFSYATNQPVSEGGHIGYREHDNFLDPNEIVLHLESDWLSDSRVNFDHTLRNDIVSHIYEVFANAYGHGLRDNGMGAVSCGEYDFKKMELRLCIVDFGIGVCETVKSFHDAKLSDEAAMHWALGRGHSTNTDSMVEGLPRGLGFHLLKEYFKRRHGSITVYSNSCCAKADGNEYSVTGVAADFKGTLVDIRVNYGSSLGLRKVDFSKNVPSFF